MGIASGEVVVFHLFDVAEAIDVRAVQQIVGGAGAQARINQRPSTPSYIQYQQPPVAFDGDTIGVPEVEGLRLRVKAYDYGVLSLALSTRLAGPWVEFIARGQQYIENDALARCAEGSCRQIMSRLRETLLRPRERLVAEDYCVFTGRSSNKREWLEVSSWNSPSSSFSSSSWSCSFSASCRRLRRARQVTPAAPF